jgi:hypothetical protein
VRGSGAEGDSADWGAASGAGIIGAAICGQGLLEESAFAIDVYIEIIK